jgi:hypothetical protein
MLHEEVLTAMVQSIVSEDELVRWAAMNGFTQEPIVHQRLAQLRCHWDVTTANNCDDEDGMTDEEWMGYLQRFYSVSELDQEMRRWGYTDDEFIVQRRNQLRANEKKVSSLQTIYVCM